MKASSSLQMDLPFAEICYADLISNYEPLAESNIRTWVETFADRLTELHRRRDEHSTHDFHGVRDVVDDLLVSARVAQFVRRAVSRPVVGDRLRSDVVFFDNFNFMSICRPTGNVFTTMPCSRWSTSRRRVHRTINDRSP